MHIRHRKIHTSSYDVNYLVFFGLVFAKNSKPCRIDIPAYTYYYRHPLDAAITDIQYIIYMYVVDDPSEQTSKSE